MSSLPDFNLTGNPKLDREINISGQGRKWAIIMLVLARKINVTEAAQKAAFPARASILGWKSLSLAPWRPWKKGSPARRWTGRPNAGSWRGKTASVIRELRDYLKFQPQAATLAESAAQIAAWIQEHNYLRCHEGLGWLTPVEVFLEGKQPAVPEQVERVRLRQEEGRVVLKFKNRRNQPARLELTLPQAA